MAAAFPLPSLGASLFSKVVAVLPRVYAQGDGKKSLDLTCRISPASSLAPCPSSPSPPRTCCGRPGPSPGGPWSSPAQPAGRPSRAVFIRNAKLPTSHRFSFFFRAEYEMPLTCAASYSAPRLRRGAISCLKMEGKEGRERRHCGSLSFLGEKSGEREKSQCVQHCDKNIGSAEYEWEGHPGKKDSSIDGALEKSTFSFREWFEKRVSCLISLLSFFVWWIIWL